MDKEITVPTLPTLETLKVMSPEGLVGEIISLETLADEHAKSAKQKNKQASEIREIVLEKMKEIGLTSVTHESGYRATIRKTPKLAIIDENIAIEAIKKSKMVNLIDEVPEKVIPAHTTIRVDVLETWIKGASAAGQKMLEGIEFTEKESLVIGKPKNN
jgi:hypothetical protein